MMKIIAVLEIRIFVVPYALYALKSIKNGNCNTQKAFQKNSLKNTSMEWIGCRLTGFQNRGVK